LGIDNIPPAVALTVTGQEKEYAQNLLSEGWLAKKDIIVGLNCAASQRWQTKRLSAEKMARLCDILSQKKIRVAITGTRHDRPEADKVQRLSRSKPLNLAGKTNIMQLAAVIQSCKVYITPDSAPMHIASLSKTPFVAIFGPTDPKRHLEPLGSHRIIYKKPRCAPCYKPDCKSRRCIDNITAEEIASSVMQLLKEQG
jgi:ADP-heptose:LPS heptosyltransferase